MVTAITGGIAEGKSTVLGYLAERGFKTLSLDDSARAIFNDAGVNSILAELAGRVFPIAPSDLRDALFAKPELRREVNRIMHSRIMEQAWRAGAEFMEVPLLIETCLQARFSSIWVVTCGADEQVRRLTERLGSTTAANRVCFRNYQQQQRFPLQTKFCERIANPKPSAGVYPRHSRAE